MADSAPAPAPATPDGSGFGLRGLVLAAALAIIGLLGVVQVGLLTAPIAGDAAGAGMEKAFRSLIVGVGVVGQLGLAGLALGVLLPEGARRPATWLGALVSLGGWLGSPLLLVVLALALGVQPGWLTSPGAEAVGVVWVTGFAGFGLVHGAARKVWVSALLVLFLLPTATLAPLGFFVTG